MTVRGLVDYHLHTSTSRDGHATVAEHCERASALGLAEIAITNHMNLRDSTLHITPEVLAEVWSDIQASQLEYPDLTILLGIEIDFFDDLKDELADVLPKYAAAVGRKLDFIMGSAHVMNGVRFASKKEAHNLLVGADPIPIYKQYFELMTRVVSSGLFDIVAHPDLIRRFVGLHTPHLPYEAYSEYAVSFVDALIEFDVGIELNVKGLVHPVGAIYPTPELLACYLDACREAGKEPVITIGTDAHRPENLGINLDVAVRRLQEHGISAITTYRQGVRIPFALPDITG